MIVEDGTIVTNANSYVDVSFADNYFSVRGETKWSSLEESQKEILLIKATDFLDSIFDWNGKKKTADQPLNFPREKLYDSNGYIVEGVPVALKKAVCVASLISSDGTELFQSAESNGAVLSEKIGDIAFTYDVAQKREDCTLYDSINKLLRGLYVDTSKKKLVRGKIDRV